MKRTYVKQSEEGRLSVYMEEETEEEDDEDNDGKRADDIIMKRTIRVIYSKGLGE